MMRESRDVNIVRYLPIILNLYISFIGISIIFGFYIPAFSNAFNGLIGSGGLISTFLLYDLSVKYKFCKFHQYLVYSVFFYLSLAYLQDNGIKINYSIYIVTIPAILVLIAFSINNYFNGWYRK